MIPEAAVEAAYDKTRVCKACGGYVDSHYFDCGADPRAIK